MKPPIYGYVRALPDLDDHAVSHLHDELVDFAEREGFALVGVFVERRWLHVVAWDALVAACQCTAVRHVVVPTFEHLHSLPILSLVMQMAVEQAIGGHVLIANHREGAPCWSASPRSRDR